MCKQQNVWHCQSLCPDRTVQLNLIHPSLSAFQQLLFVFSNLTPFLLASTKLTTCDEMQPTVFCWLMKSTSATAAFTVSKATFAASDVLKTQSSETSFFASVLKTETEMLQKREAGLHFTARHVTKKHKTQVTFSYIQLLTTFFVVHAFSFTCFHSLSLFILFSVQFCFFFYVFYLMCFVFLDCCNKRISQLSGSVESTTSYVAFCY